MAVTVSVVIPVYNAAGHLRMCLAALRQSASAPFECIVVDDGSTDASPEVAREFGATLLSTGGRSGPAHARNMGARHASGDVLFFIDADVCVHPGTLGRIVLAFGEDAELDALIGSYDTLPHSRDFLSQYKNLMHCFVHQTGRKQACTFWSGCGAIRRSVFLEHSGFDESYRRPAIEDIELGYRLIRAGKKLMLDRNLLVKHLKRWTFWNLIKTDIKDRGVPWTELILRDKAMPNDLNLQISARISVALVFLLFLFATEGAIRYGGYFLTPVLGMLFFLLGRYWVEGAAQPNATALRMMMGAALVAFVAIAWASRMLTMVPPVLLGYALLYLRDRYAQTSARRARMTGRAYAIYFVLTLIFIVTYLPNSVSVMVFYLIFIAIVIINNQFYFFLGSKWGGLCALAAIPFHLLYHFYNGLSFMAGVVRHTWRNLGERQDSSLELHAGEKRQ
ncbi:MAG: glycosyltransferase [Bryobacterales bacterium]|nr:glycosyltransferase [Bryobacterales bacterium]